MMTLLAYLLGYALGGLTMFAFCRRSIRQERMRTAFTRALYEQAALGLHRLANGHRPEVN